MGSLWPYPEISQGVWTRARVETGRMTSPEAATHEAGSGREARTFKDAVTITRRIMLHVLY